MSEGSLDPTQDIAKALAKGMKLVESAPCSIILDLDSKAAMAQYNVMLPRIQRDLVIVERERWESKTKDKNHWHVVLETDIMLTPVTRLLLQTILGSDPMKEFLSLVRYRAGYGVFSILFRPPLVNEED